MNLWIREQEKFEQGIYSNKLETAKKMLVKNKDIDEIIEFTDLSKEEIEKIQESMLVTK